MQVEEKVKDQMVVHVFSCLMDVGGKCCRNFFISRRGKRGVQIKRKYEVD